MNFKEKLLNHKKMLIGGVVALIFGTYVSHSNLVPTAEYNKLVSQKAEVVTEIANTEKLSATKTEELAKVTKEKETFEKELQVIQTEKRVEEERIKAEKLAAIEKAEKEKEQQQIASSNSSSSSSSNGGNTSSGGNSNGNSGGGSNEVSKPVVENTTPVAKMVWVTKTGGKYHSHGNCGNSKYVSQVSLSTAQGRGLGPCGTCY
ncbi:MAG: hypothetical protein ACRCWG_03155 [Sarcina sp.]